MPSKEMNDLFAEAMVMEILQPGRLAQIIPDEAFVMAKKIVQNTIDSEENQHPDIQEMARFTLRSVEAVEEFHNKVMALRAEILPLIERKRAELAVKGE